jgi:pyruvate formate lyase activating enzyme
MKVGRVVGQDFKAWKGKTSCVFYVMGCNMKCPFCFSRDFVLERLPSKNWEKEFNKYRSAVDSVVLKGGELLVQKHLSIFCKKMKLAGKKVRMETNGSKPDVLKDLLDRKVLDSVSLDVKAPFRDYAKITASSVDATLVKKSVELLKKSGVEREFTTTWSPDLSEKQVLETARQCQGETWVLQQFVPGNCLNPSFNSKTKTSKELLEATALKADGPSEVRVRMGENEKKVK